MVGIEVSTIHMLMDMIHEDNSLKYMQTSPEI